MADIGTTSKNCFWKNTTISFVSVDIKKSNCLLHVGQKIIIFGFEVHFEINPGEYP